MQIIPLRQRSNVIRQVEYAYYVRFVAHKPRFACLYMFLKHIFVLVFGTIPEHYLSALFIGAGRDECAMFGLLEPGLVLALVAC